MDGGAPYYSSRQINPPAKLGGKGAENRIWEYSCGKCARADFPDGAVGKLLRAQISRARADFPDGAVGKIPLLQRGIHMDPHAEVARGHA